uniref:Fe2OG dioxygenase domain-containing protein n=1 Tax=Lotharella oceanica TaxID=641309 RepID=A0A7S2XDL9_9EUKA|mmetsp:Transcript_26290/g.49075  ORF Transcript_26290/g.49075 Transcript_26290/m.49075 type:complete len:276 (+) Transcript_26290:167-994(+)
MMMAAMRKRQKVVQERREAAKKRVWCDGEMADGGPALAEGLKQRLEAEGLKPTISFLSSDKKSWILHCPSWHKLSKDEFKELWDSHPTEYNEIMMHGRMVKIPRWQEAFGQSYTFSGSTAVARRDVPGPVATCMARVNRLVTCFAFKMALVNWYAPQHYLGPHHDDARQLVEASPIVSITWGQTRTFRIKRNPKKECEGSKNASLDLRNGDLLLMSWCLNKTHKHEVTKLAKGRQVAAGGRINVTLRAFKASLESHTGPTIKGEYGTKKKKKKAA